MRRLLILACSSRKHDNPGLIPAIQRYDGPAWRSLRRYLRESNDGCLDVFALSAEYGLITASEPIPDYDRRMDAQRAMMLAPVTSLAVGELIRDQRYVAVMFWGGQHYKIALGSTAERASSLIIAEGPIGRKLGQLKSWLWQEHDPDRSEDVRPRRSTVGPPRVRGVILDLDPNEITLRVNTALGVDSASVGRASDWHVTIDGRCVGAKWLVSLLTGLPRSAFVTSEAVRVLRQLGYEVRRG